jgi:NTP pyrophosphatase (non-canonical NTP hydrolase)
MNVSVELPKFVSPVAGAEGPVSFTSRAGALLDFIERTGGTQLQRNGVERRLQKSIEEAGEVSEARLNLTGMNGKGKTPTDLQEEIVDVFIVLADTLFEHIRHLPAAYESERRWLRDSAQRLIENLVQPAASYSHEERFWKVLGAVVTAKQAKDAVWNYNNKTQVRALSNAILGAYSASLDMLYTFVDGLSTEQSQFDQDLLAMLERKLTKWVTALSRSSNAVQQAETPVLGTVQ